MVLVSGSAPRACLRLRPARRALARRCFRLPRRFFLEAAVVLLVDFLLSMLSLVSSVSLSELSESESGHCGSSSFGSLIDTWTVGSFMPAVTCRVLVTRRFFEEPSWLSERRLLLAFRPSLPPFFGLGLESCLGLGFRCNSSGRRSLFSSFLMRFHFRITETAAAALFAPRAVCSTWFWDFRYLVAFDSFSGLASACSGHV